MDIDLAFRPKGATHAGKEDSHGSWYKKNDAGDWLFIDMAEDGLTDRQWDFCGGDPGYKLVELPAETLTEPPAQTPVFDGGSAFPCHFNPRPDTLNEAPQGMSLRDYFAVNAAVCLDDYGVPYASSIVGRGMPDFASDPLGNQLFWAEFRARMRYAEADAMLVARSA
jgi:hypothetical protein